MLALDQGVLAGAMLNAMWQGLAIAALTLFALRFVPRLDAGVKYGVLLLAVGAVVVTPITNLSPVTEAPSVQTARMPVSASPSPVLQDVAPSFSLRVPSGSWISFAFLMWVGLSSALLLRLVASVFSLRRLVARAQPAPERLTRRLDRWCEKLRVAPVRLMVSRDLAAPVSIGLGHRVILLPPTVAETWADDDLDPILLHETAHLTRHDDWTNLISKAAAALFPFQPAMTLLERRLAEEREIACDTMALRSYPHPVRYADALLRVAAQKTRRPTLSHAMASGGKLSRRLTRIQRGDFMSNPKAPKLVLIVTAMTLGVTVFACSKSPKVQVEPTPSVRPIAYQASEATVRADEARERESRARASEQAAQRQLAEERREQAHAQRELAEERREEARAHRQLAEEKRREAHAMREHAREIRDEKRHEMRELRDVLRHDLRESIRDHRDSLRESLHHMGEMIREQFRDEDARLEHETHMLERELEREAEALGEAVEREVEQIEREIERSMEDLERQLDNVREDLGAVDSVSEVSALDALDALPALAAIDALDIDVAPVRAADPVDEPDSKEPAFVPQRIDY